MKKIILLFTVVLVVISLSAQSTSFMFESLTVPSDWQTGNGQLTITSNHFKEGSSSLCWETASGESTLTVSTRNFNISGRALFMFLRSPKITNDDLVMEFLDAEGNVQRTANITVNFMGWRELIRTYNEYANTNAFVLSSVRFTLKPTDSAPRRLYFDSVNFNSDPVNKNFGYLWVKDKNIFTSNNASLNQYSNPVDIVVVTPSASELAELALLRERMPRESTSTLNLIAARNLVNGYSITRNADGSVKGKILDCTLSAFTTSSASNILDALQTLGRRVSESVSDSTLFINMVDHMLDQGFAEGVSLRISSSAYGDARTIPAAILNIVPFLPDDKRKIEVLKLVRWLSEYGTVYYPENQYLSMFNSDLIYNYLPHMYGYALLQPDDAVAVRELKAMKRYLERHSEVVPGTSDMLKIDGTGFHHWTHYNNYMYCYRTWADYIYLLRETSFNVNKVSYIRFRDAVLAMYTMANKTRGNNHFTANSLSGRNPYTRGGINVQLNAPFLERLIEASYSIFNDGFDTELAAAYNYFYDINKYDVPSKNLDGYYQFNYSPIGVARKNDWVVTMRAPTSYFWGVEIYSGQNRFGRYQSHGTLEVIYTGNYDKSGLPTTAGSGGWDWNVVPGTTTVHYTSWRDMMPNRTTTDRFDQKATGTNFSGALAFGNNGVFSTDFVQGDNWGSQRFVPTNLKFKKSVFTFDSVFVCLGTDISAVGTYSDGMTTATNLFQEIKSSQFADLVVNDIVYPEGSTINLSNTANNWILTPLGTGYIVPAGNDALVVKYESQTTPVETGADVDAPINTSVAAKSYINHGVKPNASSYHFAMVPNASVASMRNLSAQISNNGGALYKVENQTNDFHAVTHLQSKVTGYSFFKEITDIPFGFVKSTTNEHLLMVKEEVAMNRLHFAVCNPNLRPVANTEFGFLSTPTETTLTVRGVWKVLNAVDAVQNVIIDGEYTKVTIVLSEGMPVYFTLGAMDDTSLGQNSNSNDFASLIQDKDTQYMLFTNHSEKEINIYSVNGTKVSVNKTSQKTYHFKEKNIPKGIYIVEVISGLKKKIFKVFL